jgi:hypothetical protein
MTQKARIAHLAGPNTTIQNTPPLVTSNKARAKHGLPLLANPDGSPARFDVLHPQRLAAPVTVYVEQFSAHPLEADAAELYGPPDGYIDNAGRVHKERHSASDKRLPRNRWFESGFLLRRVIQTRSWRQISAHRMACFRTGVASDPKQDRAQKN